MNLQATQRKRAWLLRLSAAMCPHAEQRWLVKCGLTLSTRSGALSSRRRTRRPQPDRRISRLSPALARTFLPGFWAVPLAERVIPATCRSSTRITSNRRARSVEVFSVQSRRVSASRARSFAMASFTRARRVEPGSARAKLALKIAEPAFPSGTEPRYGQHFASGQRRGDVDTSVDADHTARTW